MRGPRAPARNIHLPVDSVQAIENKYESFLQIVP